MYLFSNPELLSSVLIKDVLLHLINPSAPPNKFFHV